jgi:DNA-binding transcriptional ArsR family regulator
VILKPRARLKPTLWRTCRAISNRTRLRIFHFLLQKPDQTVSAIAKKFDLPLSAASLFLRLLESRGVLEARRIGRWVKYRTSSATKSDPNSNLVAAMRGAFRRGDRAVESIFDAATAFTHPRRVEIVRLTRIRPRTIQQLHVTTKISIPALRRHLRKLQARGFLEYRRGHYQVAPQLDAVRRELARLAVSL